MSLMNRRLASVVAALLAALCLHAGITAQSGPAVSKEHWVATWATAPVERPVAPKIGRAHV